MTALKYSVIMPYFERPRLLEKSLLAYDQLFRGVSIEVVVVDDHSRRNLKAQVPPGLSLKVRVVTLLGKKSGINPSLPMEVGVSQALGETLILTSPEVVPVRRFEGEFDELSASEEGGVYAVFDVFAVNNSGHVSDFEDLISPVWRLSEERLQELEHGFVQDLGLRGFHYLNSKGAWYQHHYLKNAQRHFLAMIRREDYLRIGGFNLSYRKGAGYEDDEFLGRVRKKLKVISVPKLAGVHLEHEEVSSRIDSKVRRNSNELRFRFHRLLGFGFAGSKRLLSRVNWSEEDFSKSRLP